MIPTIWSRRGCREGMWRWFRRKEEIDANSWQRNHLARRRWCWWPGLDGIGVECCGVSTKHTQSNLLNWCFISANYYIYSNFSPDIWCRAFSALMPPPIPAAQQCNNIGTVVLCFRQHSANLWTRSNKEEENEEKSLSRKKESPIIIEITMWNSIVSRWLVGGGKFVTRRNVRTLLADGFVSFGY